MLLQIFLDFFIYVVFEIFIVSIHVPGCSLMFRDVPECSMFRLLSTAHRLEQSVCLKARKNQVIHSALS